MQEIKEKFPDKAIVTVDDANFPKFTSQRNGIYGVSLAGGKGAFFKP